MLGLTPQQHNARIADFESRIDKTIEDFFFYAHPSSCLATFTEVLEGFINNSLADEDLAPNIGRHIYIVNKIGQFITELHENVKFVERVRKEAGHDN